MVMAAVSLLEEGGALDEDEVRKGLEGNLCRCTGYHNIVAAVLAGLRARWRGGRMIPAAFDYVRADSVDEAVALLAEHGDDAKLLAGGHSLLPLMKLRLATPSVLVDVGRLAELSYVRDGGDDVAIGGMTRHHDVEADPLVREQVPILARAAGKVGDPQVRHRGTLGGSLAHGDPAADLPAVVLALRGSIVVRGTRRRTGARGRRLLPGLPRDGADARRDDHRGPAAEDRRRGLGVQKFNRRAQDWAIVGVAAVGGARPASPWSTWVRPRCGPKRSRPRCAPVRIR